MGSRGRDGMDAEWGIRAPDHKWGLRAVGAGRGYTGPVMHAGDRGVSIGMVRCFPLADSGRRVVCKP